MDIQSNNNQRVKRFYIYGHYTDDGKLFYIGKGKILYLEAKTKKRFYSRAYHFLNRSNFWNHVSNKYGVNVKILFQFENEKDCICKEIELISKYGRRPFKEGSLVNITKGGEGTSGSTYIMSKKQKQLISDRKSIFLYVYSKEGFYIKKIRTIQATAEYCGVTYNAIHSCMKTKNFSNGYFIFRKYQGKKLDYTYKNLNFKSPLSKKVITISLSGDKKIHNSIYEASSYLNTDRKNLKSAINKNRLCKKHKVFLKDNQQPRP